ncbi:hypothetical protein BMT54_11705 [Pasteurellaceae bacterium 15-036681]|nr:hypothetical protein BMT54_11705 [Pasteurellaceae bacterium 15-036681]
MSSSFNLHTLLPQPSQIPNIINGSSDGLSALIVITLIAICLVFTLKVITKYRESQKNIRVYQNEIKNLKRLDQDLLAEKYREISKNIKNSESSVKIWEDFDHSLVRIGEKDHIYSTLDASNFFNQHTLARGLTENRLFAAAPGILTAIGVLGTFIGLQLGLKGINLSSNEVNEISQGIGQVINGATVAFLTSVWGVITSLAFNWYEKAAETKIRQQISALQIEIDQLFPRIIAEKSLISIQEDSTSSKNLLAGLSEQIGDQMQKVMNTASETISQNIVTSLEKALQNITATANNGSEKALEALVQQFLGKFGSIGETQKDAINQATQALALSGTTMMSHMQNFATSLEQQTQQLTENNQAMITQINSTLASQLEAQTARDEHRQQLFTQQLSQLQSNQQGVMDNMGNYLTTMSENSKETLQQLTQTIESFMQNLKDVLANFNQQSAEITKGVGSALQNQIEQQNERDKIRQSQQEALHQKSNAAQSELLQGVDNLMNAQQKQSDQISESLTQLAQKFTNLTESNQQAIQQMNSVSTNMSKTSSGFELLSTNLKQLLNDFAQQLNSIITVAGTVAQQNNHTTQLFNGLSDKLVSTTSKIETTTEHLSQASNLAKTGFENVGNHFEQLSQALNQHIESLNQQISELLENYANQVNNQTNDRLNQWNIQTNEYTTSLNNAMNTLSGIVDEIETKIGRK